MNAGTQTQKEDRTNTDKQLQGFFSLVKTATYTVMPLQFLYDTQTAKKTTKNKKQKNAGSAMPITAHPLLSV